ncbi:MAG: AI-2E family transporter [Dinoroseobacter sp.]|nr:AI-2E family transporter [Dinoroseobacter sp.]
MRDAPLLNLVLGLILAIAIGWLLLIGRSIILPILTSVIVVYVIVTASEALRKLPGMNRLPQTVLRFAVLLVFTVIFAAMAVVVTSTVREIAAVAPIYEANLEGLLDMVAAQFHLDAQEVISEARAVTVDQIDLRRSVLTILGGFTSVGASVFLVMVYSAFMLAERGGFPAKIRAALKNEARADQVSEIISDMNQKIGQYLTTKTLINVVLGIISFVILSAMQVDFALFWAIVIALFNYIPYVGSYVGVALPVILSLAQFASVPTTLILLALLTVAQVFVGNYLEPKLIGQQLNLSPLVVIVALVFWSSLWGISGAILAIPMTSVIAIVLSTFPETRFLAVMLAHQIEDEPATPDA